MMGTNAIRDDTPDINTSDAMEVEGVESAWIDGCELEIEIEAVRVSQRKSNFTEIGF